MKRSIWFRFVFSALCFAVFPAFAVIPNPDQIAAEQMKLRPLPAPSARTTWPREIRKQEVTKAENDPEKAAKLASIEELRRSEKLRKELSTFKMDVGKVTPLPEQRADGSFVGVTREELLKGSDREKRLVNESVQRTANALLSGRVRELFSARKSADQQTLDKLVSALLYYFDFELYRTGYRWVNSTFIFPNLACLTYFAFLDKMEAVESGKETAPRWVRLNQLCKEVSLQCAYQQTENRPGPVLTVESFRHHGHWVGGNFGYRPLIYTALLNRNPLMLDVAVEVILNSFSVTNNRMQNETFWSEGMTADGAGWGHGRQNYIGGYPTDCLSHGTRSLRFLQGSYWDKEIPREKLELLISYAEAALWFNIAPLQNGFTLMLPGRRAFEYHGDANVDGIARVSGVVTAIRPMIPKAHTDLHKRANHYLAVVKGKAPNPEGSRYFWNNDDMVMRRNDYFLGINMTSARTNSNEVPKAASHFTEFLGDGATYIMSRPTTYAFAKGCWDPWAVPGTTTRQGKYKHGGDVWENYTGVHDFAGGVAADGIGVCAFLYEKKFLPFVKEPALFYVRANKSYFLFEGAAVMLGAGITDLAPKQKKPIGTTIDSTEWKTILEYLPIANSIPVSAEPGATVKSPALIAVQGNVGYASLNGRPFLVDARTRKAHWEELDPRNKKIKDKAESLPVLTLSFDHGLAPKDVTYAYMVRFRTKDLASFRAQLKKTPYRILSNTPQLQAVREDATGTTEAVWFDAGAVLDDGSRKWQSDAPAVVMIRERQDGTFVITVADPEQALKRSAVTLSVTPAIHGQSSVTIPLPGGLFCGKQGQIVLAPATNAK